MLFHQLFHLFMRRLCSPTCAASVRIWSVSSIPSAWEPSYIPVVVSVSGLQYISLLWRWILRSDCLVCNLVRTKSASNISADAMAWRIDKKKGQRKLVVWDTQVRQALWVLPRKHLVDLYFNFFSGAYVWTYLSFCFSGRSAPLHSFFTIQCRTLPDFLGLFFLQKNLLLVHAGENGWCLLLCSICEEAGEEPGEERARTGEERARTGEDGRGRARTGEDGARTGEGGRGRARTGEGGRGRARTGKEVGEARRRRRFARRQVRKQASPKGVGSVRGRGRGGGERARLQVRARRVLDSARKIENIECFWISGWHRWGGTFFVFVSPDRSWGLNSPDIVNAAECAALSTRKFCSSSWLRLQSVVQNIFSLWLWKLVCMRLLPLKGTHPPPHSQQTKFTMMQHPVNRYPPKHLLTHIYIYTYTYTYKYFHPTMKPCLTDEVSPHAIHPYRMVPQRWP